MNYYRIYSLLSVLIIISILYFVCNKKKITEKFNDVEENPNTCLYWRDIWKDLQEKKLDIRDKNNNSFNDDNLKEFNRYISLNKDEKYTNTCIRPNNESIPYCITKDRNGSYKKKDCELPNTKTYGYNQHGWGYKRKRRQAPPLRKPDNMEVPCVSWEYGKSGKFRNSINRMFKYKFKNVKGEPIENPAKYAFCANPDNDSGGDWCYTNNIGSYKYCAKPGESQTKTGMNEYKNHGYSGSKCIKWNDSKRGRSQYKNHRNHKDWYRKDAQGNIINVYNSNMCINPDNDKDDWCYTGKYDGDWEFCHIHGGKDAYNKSWYWGRAK